MYPNDENRMDENRVDENKNSEPATPKEPSAPAAPGYGSGATPYTAQTNSQYTPYSSPSQYTQSGGSYSWGPGGQAQPQSYGYPASQNAGTNPGNSYYIQPPQPPKIKKKSKAGKTVLKILAAMMACAVISLSSVGIFAAMIQNGVVNVESPEGAEDSAAFTLYKRESSANTTPTVSREGMSTQEVAQKLIPSVVCVQNYQVVQQQMPGFGMFGNFGDYSMEDESEGELSPVGEGSGIIVSKNGQDAYIVTNQHVIDGATNITVVTSDGVSYVAELIGEDTQTDLAVIKVTTEDTLIPAEFGSSEDLQVTDEVLAIGNPGGLQFSSSVTIGHISALNRPVTNGDTGYIVNCIQTDAAINPGNSGGALVNEDGLVVGINSSKIAATEYEGMGFAIPSDIAQPIVSDLIEHGYVTNRPMLGIKGDYINRTVSSFYGLPQGFLVRELSTQGAKDSELQVSDVITAIDDVQVTSANTVASYLANKKPGDKVTLTVDRVLTGEEGLTIELSLSANTGASN